MRKATKAHKLQELEDKVEDYDVIAIDEGQFFQDVESPLITVSRVLYKMGRSRENSDHCCTRGNLRKKGN